LEGRRCWQPIEIVEIKPLGTGSFGKGFAKGGGTGAGCASDMNAQRRSNLVGAA
jgi:hypothetical protein